MITVTVYCNNIASPFKTDFGNGATVADLKKKLTDRPLAHKSGPVRVMIYRTHDELADKVELTDDAKYHAYRGEPDFSPGNPDGQEPKPLGEHF
jgi:hypothetical protein